MKMQLRHIRGLRGQEGRIMKSIRSLVGKLLVAEKPFFAKTNKGCQIQISSGTSLTLLSICEFNHEMTFLRPDGVRMTTTCLGSKDLLNHLSDDSGVLANLEVL